MFRGGRVLTVWRHGLISRNRVVPATTTIHLHERTTNHVTQQQVVSGTMDKHDGILGNVNSITNSIQDSNQIQIYQQFNDKKILFNINSAIDSKTAFSSSVIDDTLNLQKELENLKFPSILSNSLKFRHFIGHYLPFNFPHSVSNNYIPYTLWSCLGMIFGSMNGVLATQCLLYALGMGYSKAIPLSASINWILKNGIGQMLAMYIASYVNNKFDAFVKKWRFMSSIFMEFAVLLEVITPLFGNKWIFLLFASIANASKNICWLSTSATKAHIHKYFCKCENLADITAKNVSQTIGASLIGTGLGMCLSYAIMHGLTTVATVGTEVAATGTANDIIETFYILPIACTLSILHIGCVYRCLRYIHDPLINIWRYDILSKQFINHYCNDNSIDGSSIGKNENENENENCKLLTPMEMIRYEPNFVLDKQRLRFMIGKVYNKLLKRQEIIDNDLKYDEVKFQMRINPKLDEVLNTDGYEKYNFNQLFKENNNDEYYIHIEIGKNILENKMINIWFDVNATNDSVLEGMLAVCYWKWIQNNQDTFFSGTYNNNDDIIEKEQLEKCKQFAKQHSSLMKQCLLDAGWDVDNLYLELQKNRLQTKATY